jgi:hypothetical protein
MVKRFVSLCVNLSTPYDAFIDPIDIDEGMAARYSIMQLSRKNQIE